MHVQQQQQQTRGWRTRPAAASLCQAARRPAAPALIWPTVRRATLAGWDGVGRERERGESEGESAQRPCSPHTNQWGGEEKTPLPSAAAVALPLGLLRQRWRRMEKRWLCEPTASCSAGELTSTITTVTPRITRTGFVAHSSPCLGWRGRRRASKGREGREGVWLGVLVVRNSLGWHPQGGADGEG